MVHCWGDCPWVTFLCINFNPSILSLPLLRVTPLLPQTLTSLHSSWSISSVPLGTRVVAFPKFLLNLPLVIHIFCFSTKSSTWSSLNHSTPPTLDNPFVTICMWKVYPAHIVNNKASRALPHTGQCFTHGVIAKLLSLILAFNTLISIPLVHTSYLKPDLKLCIAIDQMSVHTCF